MNETTAPLNQATDAVLEGVVHAGQSIEQAMEEAARPHGLSVAKMGVVHVLAAKREPLPLGNLSRELHCVKSNITQLMDRLEADGLVRRMADPEDRRSVRAEITEEGRRRYEAGWRAVQEARQGMLKRLSESEREQLLGLLARMSDDRG